MIQDDSQVVHSHNPMADTTFPLLILNVKNKECYPENQGFGMVHWHEELQFIYVVKGVVLIRVYDREIEVKAEQALFINRGVLHRITEKIDCQYCSFIFPEQMLGFFAGSYMEHYDVRSVTNNKNFSAYFFDCQTEAGMRVLVYLKQLHQLQQQKDEIDHFEYQTAAALVCLWMEFITLVKLPEAVVSRSSLRKQQRVRDLLNYIHDHYDQPITLDGIAAAANISKAECSRCFKGCLKCSPFEYLIQYRINQSFGLLLDTSLSVTEIAGMVGFDSLSYFNRCFKNIVKLTPNQYRKNKKMNI